MGADCRAVSESAGVAALLVITVVATASVGLSVVIVAEDGDDGSEFPVEFQYSGDLSQLTVFYNGDQPVAAGDVVIDGPDANVTWAELAGIPADEQVAAGDQPVFLNDASPYGNDVAETDVIRVVHTPPDGEPATAVWNEDASGDGSGDDAGPDPADDPVS